MDITPELQSGLMKNYKRLDMKNKFPDYYKPSKEEYSLLWKNADIVLDANVLLDFYRVSESTYNDMMKLFTTIKDRTWIPYQVAKEYHRNIKPVVVEQEGKYRDTLKFIKNFNTELAQTRNHPFLSDELSTETEKVFENLVNFIEKQQQNLFNNLTENDSTKDRIAELFDGKVWDGLTPELKQNLCEEGETRYSNKIPPGYKDKKKQGEDKYGDLIIWKEIISWAKENKKSIIFVTNDEKEDWIFKCEGRTIGPHQELISEFNKETDGQKLLIYKLHQFLELSNNNLDIDINKESVEELKTALRTQIVTNITTDGSKDAETSDLEDIDKCSEEKSSAEVIYSEYKSKSTNILGPDKNIQITKNKIEEKGNTDGNTN